MEKRRREKNKSSIEGLSGGSEMRRNEREEFMKGRGETKGKEGSVSGSRREEKAGRGVGVTDLLLPHRRCCNLGHMSHKACWSPRDLAG